MEKLRALAFVCVLALGLQGCAALDYLSGVFPGVPGVEEIQQSRTAREAHVAVAGMFEVIVKELTLMLKDGTLTAAQGQQIQPMIELGRTAIAAAGAFLLQAGQERELGRGDIADKLEDSAFDQLRTANANLDLLRVVHLGAVQTAPQPFVAEPPPLLLAPPTPTEG